MNKRTERVSARSRNGGADLMGEQTPIMTVISSPKGPHHHDASWNAEVMKWPYC
jgi:hypothetical protein